MDVVEGSRSHRVEIHQLDRVLHRRRRRRRWRRRRSSKRVQDGSSVDDCEKEAGGRKRSSQATSLGRSFNLTSCAVDRQKNLRAEHGRLLVQNLGANGRERQDSLPVAVQKVLIAHNSRVKQVYGKAEEAMSATKKRKKRSTQDGVLGTKGKTCVV
ncbi:hypothetical protein GUITHDRAFT_151810 [Guillardia theta CCMP2712]|uniref:Uncharacterized protein n=1 Tax=Guillardia theta (strain CCMP2712) TaxID=905079 RepID=L1JKH9_GUITC|nr:hypothetical protein GUITHDRAFT_151810 [Guillardia theta CCMP2712]EKX48649.1 hypothetical protein GUITHDRAFT_151810 [Guillardia theta CCMP2712]|eukprot:XP_005835629.1 hypothetical protein GUITHDRAFT_151810 [Guillardia theta CCMP2712]